MTSLCSNNMIADNCVTEEPVGRVYYLVRGLLTFGTVGFVWFYDQPLAADMPMHVAIAKAFGDLLQHPDAPNYPYIMSLKLTPYALPEMLLAILVKLFGVVNGAKVALSLFCVTFPVVVGYLVAQVSPRSRWTRLVGYPLTLNYFFHFGFWPYLLALCAAVATLGFSVRHSRTKKDLWIGAGLRTLTFMMHPIAAVAVGVHDIVAILLDLDRIRQWYLPLWNWGRMLRLWGPVMAVLCVILMTNSLGYTGYTVWSSWKGQLTQVVRPLYVTEQWWEMAVPIGLGLLIFVRGCADMVCAHRGLFWAGLAMLGCGAVFPRELFLGSWEHGARIVFIGWIVLLSLWSVCERQCRTAILVSILAAFSANLTVSHRLWHRHDASFQQVLSEIKAQFAGSYVRSREPFTPNRPSVYLGNHVALWAWCNGYTAGAFNFTATFNFGPVAYSGPPKTTSDKGTGLVIYHPYQLWPSEPGKYSECYLANDSIYSLYRH